MVGGYEYRSTRQPLIFQLLAPEKLAHLGWVVVSGYPRGTELAAQSLSYESPNCAVDAKPSPLLVVAVADRSVREGIAVEASLDAPAVCAVRVQSHLCWPRKSYGSAP